MLHAAAAININAEAVRILEGFGREGFIVSVCCGPCGSEPFAWTVTVLSPDGQEFEKPLHAMSFAHAVVIANVEIESLGWRKGTRLSS